MTAGSHPDRERSVTIAAVGVSARGVGAGTAGALPPSMTKKSARIGRKVTTACAGQMMTPACARALYGEIEGAYTDATGADTGLRMVRFEDGHTERVNVSMLSAVHS